MKIQTHFLPSFLKASCGFAPSDIMFPMIGHGNGPGIVNLRLLNLFIRNAAMRYAATAASTSVNVM